VHPWSELPYDAHDYDARAAVIGIAAGPDGNLYVLTRCIRNSCTGRKEPPILKFSPEGKLLASWGVGLFDFPHNLTIDADGHVWTTDEGNHVVRKFTPTGELLMTIGEPGKAGGPPTRLTSPTGVVVGANGHVFVTEGHDNSPTAPVARVSKWTAKGEFVKTWGRTGSAPGEFSTPHVIALDSRSRLFVGDRNNNRIQIFDQEGNFLDLWYQFGRPSGIVITADDRIYVADSESFDFHNPGWEKGIRIGSAKDGSVQYFIRDIEPTTISHSGAEGIGVDAKGHIYGGVVRRRMLEKFVPATPNTPPAAAATPASAPSSGQAMTHVGHVATGFDQAPGGRGLSVTAAMEVNAAMMHANLAAGHRSDLAQMHAHTRHVLHALAPANGAKGPGLGFGVARAADAIATHIELAAKAGDASATIRKLGPGVATAARAVARRAHAMVDLGSRILAATTVADAAPLADELRALALALDTGRDADGNGRIDLESTEPGMNQLEAGVYAILEGDKRPRILQ
jgi:sugar lactone lactonase YvrE